MAKHSPLCENWQLKFAKVKGLQWDSRRILNDAVSEAYPLQNSSFFTRSSILVEQLMIIRKMLFADPEPNTPKDRQVSAREMLAGFGSGASTTTPSMPASWEPQLCNGTS